MGFTPEQIKGRIKSVAKQNNADARTLMRIYMMERFLERLARSEYRDNFIIKGGILVTAMIGVAHRSTMDIDTSMKNLNLSAEDALQVVNQVKDIDLDDGVSFEVKDVSNIMDEMMWFDKFSCKRSDLVITVGRDLVETVENRFKGKKVPKTVMINNWIDENEIYPLDESNERVVAFKKKYGLDGKFVIMYSGNIGLYYDLENLIKVVEKFKAGTKTADGREVVFAFVGAGSVLDKLVLYVKEHHMDNVTFIPYQDKADLIYSLNAGDVHWCVNAKGIKGVSCPSKAYGIMAASKPILGVLESGSEIRCIDGICTFCAKALFLELCVYYKTLAGELHPRTC